MPPIYEWQCETCGANKTEMVSVSEIGDGKRHPMDEKPPCPQGHGPMMPLLGGKPGIKMSFPLADAADRYQDQLRTDEAEEQRPLYDRYCEDRERKDWQRKRNRGEGKIIVGGT